ncbi:hypothetical protein J6590_062937 [Homalodisca vitripennis]|nr:hypothetical protein J6590_062937 [Homalodisca vitripennis]
MLHCTYVCGWYIEDRPVHTTPVAFQELSSLADARARLSTALLHSQIITPNITGLNSPGLPGCWTTICTEACRWGGVGSAHPPRLSHSLMVTHTPLPVLLLVIDHMIHTKHFCCHHDIFLLMETCMLIAAFYLATICNSNTSAFCYHHDILLLRRHECLLLPPYSPRYLRNLTVILPTLFTTEHACRRLTGCVATTQAIGDVEFLLSSMTVASVLILQVLSLCLPEPETARDNRCKGWEPPPRYPRLCSDSDDALDLGHSPPVYL